MKIAFFSNSSWSIYNFRRNLVKKLLIMNHQIVIISSKDDFTEKLIKMGCSFVNIDLNNNKINPLKEILILFKINYIFIKIRPDILLNFTIKPLIYGSFFSRMFSIKSINMITGLGTTFININFLTKIVIFFYKISFQKIYAVFFQNKDDLKLFINNQIIKKKKTILIPGSGVDLKHYKFSKLKKNKKIRFILVSRILKEKGILEYLKVAKNLHNKKNCEFHLLGPFIQDNKSTISKKIIDDLHNKKIIKYLGFVKNIKPYVKNSDCVVLPSYREGTPRSLLEACSMGRPIITTDVPGCRNVIRNNINGFKCLPRSSKSLESSIKKFINLTYRQKVKMSLSARKLVEQKFDEKIIISKYIDIIKLINEKKN